MTRSLRTRIERLEEEYRPPVVDEEEIDYYQLTRRLGMLARLAASGDEKALEWERKAFGNIKPSPDKSDEQDEP
ncbi:MAG: hypothetical protein V2I51_18615 [Anderseniella sp.]|jgi:hypothetical protein|nr:hypothetical protein [Anderseniella sp.]